MAKSILVNQNRRGRPPTGRDPVSAVRLPADLTAAIDVWATKNGSPSRSDAIRRLVEKALAGEAPMPLPRSKGIPAAIEFADREIDKLSDPAAPPEERASRKRRLLKGPKEFRKMRGDQRKR